MNEDYRGTRDTTDADIFATRDIHSGSSFETNSTLPLTSSPYLIGAIDSYVLDTLRILRSLVGK